MIRHHSPPVLLFLLLVLTLTWPASAQAQQACPTGKTNVGCAPAEMDAYGCCPVKKAASPSRRSSAPAAAPQLPQWGQRASDGLCSIGLMASRSTGGVCCWPGQSYNGVTCVGAPQCPFPYVASGGGCELGSCRAGQERATDGLHCCWPGQTFSLEIGDCVGTPACPAGSDLVGDTCVRPVVAVSGKRRASREHAILGTVHWIPAGGFRMGSGVPGTGNAAHDVQLTRGYWMTRSEVTQAAWRALLGNNPAWFDDCGSTCPVEDVDWFDAVRFANELSSRDGLTPAYVITGSAVTWDASADGWRLPTEAEWEYAARGGRAGSGLGGWHKGNSDETTHPVCQAGANGFGLCDMSGNVWEWVWDWYGPYPTDLVADPTGPAAGRARVRRGGAWSEPQGAGALDVRDARAPGGSDDELGLRLVRSEAQ